MSKNFYISDTHLGHANIIGFDGREFKDTAEMEKVIIENWNSRVAKGIPYIFLVTSVGVQSRNG